VSTPARWAVWVGSYRVVVATARTRGCRCVHPRVEDESDREKVDAMCRSMTAQWVRAKAATDTRVQTCDFFETYDK